MDVLGFAQPIAKNDFEVQILPGPKPDVDGPTLAAPQHERIHRGLRI